MSGAGLPCVLRATDFVCVRMHGPDREHLYAGSYSDPPGTAGRMTAHDADAGNAITHLAQDVAGDALTGTFSRLNAEMAESVVLRTRQQRYRLHGLRRARPSVLQTGADTPSENAPEAFLGMLPEAFLGMLDGKNFAELLIRVS